MKRQSLDNGSWFNLETAEQWNEDTYWNGSNHISAATRSQTEHESLYRTKSGRWILNTWSQWQGTQETWIEIDSDAAAKWLVTNGKDPHDACAEEYAALEL